MREKYVEGRDSEQHKLETSGRFMKFMANYDKGVEGYQGEIDKIDKKLKELEGKKKD